MIIDDHVQKQKSRGIACKTKSECMSTFLWNKNVQSPWDITTKGQYDLSILVQSGWNEASGISINISKWRKNTVKGITKPSDDMTDHETTSVSLYLNTPTSSNVRSHMQRQPTSYLTRQRRSREDTSPDFNFGVDTITQLEYKVLDEHRQHSLPKQNPRQKLVATTYHACPVSTHLEFRHGEILSQACPWPIDEREQVTMSLNFFRLGGDPILTVGILEPPAWSKHFGIFTPKCGRTVHGFYRDRNQSAFGDREAIYKLSRFRSNGLREGDHVIFDGL